MEKKKKRTFFIYKTTNLLNGKIYIGQHSTYKMNDGYLGSGNGIIAAINKYGKENFSREIIVFANNKEELNILECFFIKFFRNKFGRKMMYNKDDGGKCIDAHWYNNGEEEIRTEYCPDGFVEGRLPVSEETREKISKANVGTNNSFYGRKHSEETKKLLSQAAKNRTAEHTRKINEAKAGRHFFNNGEICVYKKECPDGFVEGRLPMREETKKKLSETHKGMHMPPRTEEHKANISKALKGKERSEAHRKALSKAIKGKVHHTEEWKKENSERVKGSKWYNNGVICIMSKEQPDGFVPGRLKFKKKNEK